MGKGMMKMMNGFVSFLKARDLFGQAVTFNYKGEDTYNTLPGGLISLFIWLALIAYTILKFNLMINKQEWVLT